MQQMSSYLNRQADDTLPNLADHVATDLAFPPRKFGPGSPGVEVGKIMKRSAVHGHTTRI